MHIFVFKEYQSLHYLFYNNPNVFLGIIKHIDRLSIFKDQIEELMVLCVVFYKVEVTEIFILLGKIFDEVIDISVIIVLRRI